MPLETHFILMIPEHILPSSMTVRLSVGSAVHGSGFRMEPAATNQAVSYSSNCKCITLIRGLILPSDHYSSWKYICAVWLTSCTNDQRTWQLVRYAILCKGFHYLGEEKKKNSHSPWDSPLFIFKFSLSLTETIYYWMFIKHKECVNFKLNIYHIYI